ncbi:unnamed protein product [Caenorhabditis bovis]|uniref:KAT8 regulatory NSL complex subunit 2 n=1 Tax=Caenorhabditis bovis TaxID=2654633 RepID=A0A8S1EIW3_9PELO|nr:unnamed protein product [Caenorhabditis bovis]
MADAGVWEDWMAMSDTISTGDDQDRAGTSSSASEDDGEDEGDEDRMRCLYRLGEPEQCNQRRLFGHSYCSSHIIQDRRALYGKCLYQRRSTRQCQRAVRQGKEYCASHQNAFKNGRIQPEVSTASDADDELEFSELEIDGEEQPRVRRRVLPAPIPSLEEYRREDARILDSLNWGPVAYYANGIGYDANDRIAWSTVKYPYRFKPYRDGNVSAEDDEVSDLMEVEEPSLSEDELRQEMEDIQLDDNKAQALKVEEHAWQEFVSLHHPNEMLTMPIRVVGAENLDPEFPVEFLEAMEGVDDADDDDSPAVLRPILSPIPPNRDQRTLADKLNNEAESFDIGEVLYFSQVELHDVRILEMNGFDQLLLLAEEEMARKADRNKPLCEIQSTMEDGGGLARAAYEFRVRQQHDPVHVPPADRRRTREIVEILNQGYADWAKQPDYVVLKPRKRIEQYVNAAPIMDSDKDQVELGLHRLLNKKLSYVVGKLWSQAIYLTIETIHFWRGCMLRALCRVANDEYEFELPFKKIYTPEEVKEQLRPHPIHMVLLLYMAELDDDYPIEYVYSPKLMVKEDLDAGRKAREDERRKEMMERLRNQNPDRVYDSDEETDVSDDEGVMENREEQAEKCGRLEYYKNLREDGPTEVVDEAGNMKYKYIVRRCVKNYMNEEGVVVRCENTALTHAEFCPTHIMDNRDQKFFAYCLFNDCGNPVNMIDDIVWKGKCKLHREIVMEISDSDVETSSDESDIEVFEDPDDMELSYDESEELTLHERNSEPDLEYSIVRPPIVPNPQVFTHLPPLEVPRPTNITEPPIMNQMISDILDRGEFTIIVNEDDLRRNHEIPLSFVNILVDVADYRPPAPLARQTIRSTPEDVEPDVEENALTEYEDTDGEISDDELFAQLIRQLEREEAGDEVFDESFFDQPGPSE